MLSMPRPNAAALTLDASGIVLTTLGNAARMTHVPFLQGAAALALNIIEIAQNVGSNKNGFQRLANDACALVYIIVHNDDYKSANGANVTPAYLEHARQLSETLKDIYEFTKAQASKNKVLRIIQSRSDAGVIQEYRERLRQSLDVFGLRSTISIQDSLASIQERLANVHNLVLHEQEPKQQNTFLTCRKEQGCFDQKQEREPQSHFPAHMSEHVHYDETTESTCTVDIHNQEESEAVIDRNQSVTTSGTSLIAVLNDVHNTEIFNADMVAVVGDTNAPSELQTRNKMPDVVAVINNSSNLKIHGGTYRAVCSNMYAQ